MVGDLAVDTLADAERLAAAVLAEAQQRAQRMLASAATAGRPKEEQSRTAIDAVFRARHEELMTILRECRDHLHAALDRPAYGIDHRATDECVGPLTAIDYFGEDAPAPPTDRSGAAAEVDVRTRPPREVAGPPSPGGSSTAVDGRWISSPEEDRIGTIRMSARRAASRAAGERLAMQTEALERRALGRRANITGPLSSRDAAAPKPLDGDDVVVPLTGGRDIPPSPVHQPGARPDAS